MKNEIPAQLQDYQAFAAEIEAQGGRITKDGKQACCPVHQDKNPSAQISAGSDGVWRMFCHTCNLSMSLADLIAHRTGEDSSEVFKSMLSDNDREQTPVKPIIQPEPEPVKVAFQDIASISRSLCDSSDFYRYTHVGGRVALIVLRKPSKSGAEKSNGKIKKDYLQLKPVDGGFAWGRPDGLMPVLNIKNVMEADKVVVVEGESSAKALLPAWKAVTTSSGGAGKADKTDWSALAGKKVLIMPDDDEAGAKHAEDIKAILVKHGCRVNVLDVEQYGPDRFKGYDIADMIKAQGGGTGWAKVLEMINANMPGDSVSQAFDHLRKVASGELRSLPLDLGGRDTLNNGSRWTRPGSLVCLCADPEAGKSLFLMQAAASWALNGERTSVWMLEEGPETHIARMAAQFYRDSRILDEEYLRQNPEVVDKVENHFGSWLREATKHWRYEQREATTYATLIEWMESEAKAGSRVIVVDPITIACKGDQSVWEADEDLIRAAKAISTDYGCTIIISTHPKGGQGGIKMTNMAGGMALPRFAQVVIWMAKHGRKMSTTVDGPVFHNRTMHVLKRRHGAEGPREIAMNIVGQSVTFEDLGFLYDESEDMPEQRKKDPPAPVHDKKYQEPSDEENMFI